MNDRGLYSCNLHHLYCHLYEMVRIQLNVTKSRKSAACVLTKPPLADLCVCNQGRKQQRFWDGQKAVYVVLLGSAAVLPCINRHKVWTDLSDEEDDHQVCEVVVLDGTPGDGLELTPGSASSRWFTGTARPPEWATTAQTGWWTSTPPGSGETTAHSFSK